MARSMYFRYRDPDSTILWNEMFRRMFEPGVYQGFTVGTGSAGWQLSFTHITDPDDATKKLGKIMTRDGCVIHEDADQTDVVTGSVSAGLPNIHYVVANYAYNDSYPPNDVTYIVRQGTAGSPPVPPSLTEDEVLIAEIYVPSGAASYAAAGVEIRNVAKKTLINEDSSASRDLVGVLRPGIYDALSTYEGSTSLDVSLAAGTWVSQENTLITESVAQADLFTLSNPGVGQYAYVWVIGAHKWAAEDPIPSADYLIVEGTPAAVGAAAVPPTDLAIRLAVATLNPKYDTDGDTYAETDYVNKLGLIRVENRAATYYIDYVRGEAVELADTLTVYGGTADATENRSGKYYGFTGLEQAISDIYTISSTRDTIDKPYTLKLDGEFKLDDTPLHIPSNIHLIGAGSPANILSEDAASVVRVEGFEAAYNGVNDSVSQVAGASSPPAGKVARELTITATYRLNDDIVTRLFSKGDLVYAWSPANATLYEGTYVQNITTANNWTFECFIDTQYNTDGNPLDLEIVILKRNIGLKNVTIDQIASGGGGLFIGQVKDCKFDNLSCRDLTMDHQIESKFGYLLINDLVTWDTSAPGYMEAQGLLPSASNTFGHIKLIGSQAALNVGTGTEDSNIALIEYDNASQVNTLSISFERCNIGTIKSLGDTASIIALPSALTKCNINQILNQSTTGEIQFNSTGQYNTILLVDCNTLDWNPSSNNTIVQSIVTTFNKITTDDDNNKVLFGNTTNAGDDNLIHKLNSDRNTFLASEASITWDLATDTLSWDGDIRLYSPWSISYSNLATGSQVLNQDDRLYVNIDRTTAAPEVLTHAVSTKAAATSVQYFQDQFFLAIREQDVIYMMDGTRIEDGQSIKLGATPPPDGSVTYEKLASSALAFHRDFYNDYVSPTNVSGSTWPDELVLENTGSATMAYTSATGVITYTGTIDLVAAGVRVGDTLLLPNRTNGHQRLEIIDVSNASSKQIGILPGLTLVPGAATRWNGAIVRGNVAVSNTGLTSFTYNKTTGRITYSSNMFFTDNQVQTGYLFVDSAGRKFRISSVGNGAYVDIDIASHVDVTAPTLPTHGSIICDNNPYEIPAGALECVGGTEFIPLDWIGDIDTSVGTVADDTQDRFATLRFHTNPYDPRVRVYSNRIYDVSRVPYIADGTSSPELRPIAIEFTGVCTGVAVVLDDPNNGDDVYVYLDGASIYNIDEQGNVLNNAYGANVNSYHMVHDRRWMGQWPQGVHTVRVSSDALALPSYSIKGLLILNTPWNETLPDNFITDSPGRGIVLGGQYNKSTPTKQQSYPSLDRGGSIVRYIDDTGSHAWAYTEFSTRSSSNCGVSNGSRDITVPGGDGVNWQVGDIIRVSGSIEEIHVIESFPSADTLRVVNTSGWGGLTIGTATIRYYGRSFLGGSPSRYLEEVAQTLTAADFAVPGPQDTTHAALGLDSTARTIGCRLSDCSTGIKSNSIESNSDYISFGNASELLRFVFTGTGVSIETLFAATLDIDISIDGNLIGTYSALDYASDVGGNYIVGELNYGTHILELEVSSYSSGYVYIKGITVFQPKEPTYTGLPLLKTNVLGPKIATAGNGVDIIPQGVLQYEAARLFDCDLSADDMLVDAYVAGVTATTTGRTLNTDAGWDATERLIFHFWGDEFTLLTNDITLGADAIDVEIMDNDGSWLAPSALTGFGVTGVDTLSASATDGVRTTWAFDRVGFHSISFVPDGAGTDLEIEAIEIHSPFHCHHKKLPVNTDQYLPMHHTGDARPMSPFPADLVGGNYGYIASARQNDSVEIATGTEPFWFYSPGGYVEVSVTARYAAGNVASGGYMTFDVDGMLSTEYHLYLVSGGTFAIGDHSSLSGRMGLYLSEGMHFARLQTAHAADAVYQVEWTAKTVSIVPHGNQSLRNRPKAH